MPISSFRKLLGQMFQAEDTAAPLDHDDAQLALTALLVRLARADGHFSPAERARILRVIRARYALDDATALALLAEAEKTEAEAPDTVRFTRAIKASVAFDERLGVISALWEIALADGVREAEEDALIRMVSSLLGVSDFDSAQARQQVERGQ